MPPCLGWELSAHYRGVKQFTYEPENGCNFIICTVSTRMIAEWCLRPAGATPKLDDY
jgi:hypothetical protein